MAQYLALKFAAETKDAVRNVGMLTKSLGRLLLGANKMTLGARGINTTFLSVGSTLVGTAVTVGLMASTVEAAAFRSRLALDRVGVSAMGMAKEFQASGRSATALLPVAARFARFGIVGDQLKAVTDVAFDMGFALEIGAQKAGEGLADIAGAMQLKTEPQIRRLASSLTMLERNFQGTYDSNVQLLKTLGSTAHYLEMDASALLGANVAMQNVGISAGDAQGALGEILKVMSQSPDAAGSLAMSLDMTGARLQRFKGLDTAEQLRELLRAMAGKEPLDLAYRLEAIAGISRPTAFALANMAGKTERLNEVFGIAVTTGKEVGEEAAARAKTLRGALELLWGKMTSLAQTAGDKIEPTLVKLVNVLSDVVDWIKSWPPGILHAATSIVGLTGSVLGLMAGLRVLGVGVRFIFGIGEAATVAGGAVTAAGGAATAAGEAAVAAAGKWGLLGRTLGGIRGIVVGMIPELGALAGASALTLTAVGAAAVGEALVVGHMIQRAGEMIEDNWDEIKMRASNLAGNIGDFFSGVAHGIGSFFGGISSAIGSVGDALFGSSMFHIKEGIAEVMPSLRRMEGAFNSVGQSAGGIGIEAQIPKPFEAAGRVGIEAPLPAGIEGRLPDPLNVMTATERALGAMMPILLGKQAFGGPAGSGPGRDMSSPAVGGVGAGGEPVGGSVRIVVPVTVELEGHVLARVIAEYHLDLGRERYMEAPVETMRATGG